MKLKNIPNILSVTRIFLVFVFVAVLFGLDSPLAAIAVFLAAGITDVLDGYLARRNGWITNLGKLLDPIADKLMQCTVLVGFCIKGIIPVWFVIPYFLKEGATLIIGWVVIKRRNVVVVSKWYGKAAVCLFYVTVVLSVLVRDAVAGRLLWQILLFSPAVILATVAFFSYIKHYSVLKRNEIEKGKLRDVIK